jgi:hypothetical protein
MTRVSFSLSAVILAVAGFAHQAAGETPTSSSPTEVALTDLHRYLGEGDNGQRWRKFLMSGDLAAELAKGAQADRAKLAAILARYSGPERGLEMPHFVAVRKALAAWDSELSQEQPAGLAPMARDAAGKFQPISPQQTARSRAEVQAALAGLDALLKNSPPDNDTGWRKYLRWEELTEQAQRPEGPEPRVAEAAITRLSAYENGLEMPQFARVRRALRRHLDTSQAAADAKIAETYSKQLEDLATLLEKHAQTGSTDDALAISRTVAWLRRSHQARELTAAIERRFNRPNVYASVSERFLAAGIEDDVDRTQGVTDVILGTQIQGTARTTGRTHVDVVPNDRSAQLDILLTGQAASNNVGYNGPVTIYSTGLTNISGRKILVMNEEGLYGYGATASCATSTNIYAIQSCCNLIEKFAWSQAMRQKGQAEAIASDHAAARVAGQMDAQAAEMIADANQRYTDKLRTPLLSRDGFPQKLEFRSGPEQVDVTGLALGTAGLGATEAPPAVSAAHDVTVRAHESAVVNFGEAMLGGVTLTDEKLEKTIRDDLKAEVPEELKITPEKDPWSITFADEAPVRAVFAGGQLGLAIRGRRFTRGDQALSEPIEISAKYAIEKTQTGSKLTRQGEVDVKFLERERLGAQQVAFKTFLTRKFEALFKQEIVSEGIVLKGRLEKAGKLQVQEIASDKGWIAIGWQLATPPKPPEVAAAQ